MKLRRTPLAAIALAVALSTAACGSDSKDTDKAADAKAPGASEAPKDSGDRTITDVLGRSVKVPANPKRVVTVSEIDQDSALALDVKPIGTVNGRGQKTPPRYLADKSQDVKIVGDVGKLDLDKILDLEPDLIITGGSSTVDPAVLDKLNKIAPTVATGKPGTDWKTAFKGVAQALNQDEKAKTVLAAYDKKIADTKVKLGANAGAVVSLARWNPQGPVVMTNSAVGSQVLADLGVKRPASQQATDQAHSQPLSLEALNQLDGDFLFLGTLTASGDDTKALETAKSTPAYQALNAVKNNKVTAVDGSQWTSVGGPLAASAIVDEIAKVMAPQ